jgi:cytochrome c oxidase cbb3-type subunit 3
MRNKLNSKWIFSFLLTCSFSLAATAQEVKEAAREAAETPPADPFFNTITVGMVLLLLIIFFGVMHLAVKIKSIGKEEQPSVSLRQWWSRLDAKLFTKAIPLEKEADHLLDHDYDGIKELDNSLPPWWKYGFYVSVVFAVIYMLRFHVWNTGPTPEQEYQTEMAMAEKQIEEYRKKSGDMVDEKTVTLADAKGIEEGAKIFAQSCMACHGGKGEGGVGPNLTDNYWMHGGTINDVFKTIKFGVPEKGMQAWEKTFSPSQIKNIASYIKSLAGTNPPNGKAPQGEPFEEKVNNNTVAKDSAAIAKR